MLWDTENVRVMEIDMSPLLLGPQSDVDVEVRGIVQGEGRGAVIGCRVLVCGVESLLLGKRWAVR